MNPAPPSAKVRRIGAGSDGSSFVTATATAAPSQATIPSTVNTVQRTGFDMPLSIGPPLLPLAGASAAGGLQPPGDFSFRQPPARLLATICRNMAPSARALIVSPR